MTDALPGVMLDSLHGDMTDAAHVVMLDSILGTLKGTVHSIVCVSRVQYLESYVVFLLEKASN